MFDNERCSCFVSPEAKPETAANEGMTSPAKSMEKKTDLFQLQKACLLFTNRSSPPRRVFL